jgi:hypothetical protein
MMIHENNCNGNCVRMGGNNCRYCGADLGPREGRLPDSLPERKEGDEWVEYRPKWVGVYSVGLTYGGPEEGGWWRTIAQHLASAMVRDGDDPFAIARELWEAFRDEDDGRDPSDSLASGAVQVLWEAKPNDREHANDTHYT